MDALAIVKGRNVDKHVGGVLRVSIGIVASCRRSDALRENRELMPVLLETLANPQCTSSHSDARTSSYARHRDLSPTDDTA